MSDFTFSVGSTACEILSWTGVSAGSCYQPTDMSVLGTILLGLTPAHGRHAVAQARLVALAARSGGNPLGLYSPTWRFVSTSTRHVLLQIGAYTNPRLARLNPPS